MYMYLQKWLPKGAKTLSTTYINLIASLEVKNIRTFEPYKTYANEGKFVRVSTFPGHP